MPIRPDRDDNAPNIKMTLIALRFLFRDTHTHQRANNSTGRATHCRAAQDAQQDATRQDRADARNQKRSRRA